MEIINTFHLIKLRIDYSIFYLMLYRRNYFIQIIYKGLYNYKCGMLFTMVELTYV